MTIFYRPTDGVAADFIPFFWDGEYHLFYLKDYRDPKSHGEGTPWWQLVTRDFVSFDDRGEALPRGAQDAQDLWVFTGSVVEGAGAFHIFYTGHNSHFDKTDRPVQAVMHATSPNLGGWTKDPEFVFLAPTEQYEKDDWRDPFVWWNADTGEYWMLLAARKKAGGSARAAPSRNRGCIALATSPDLRHWTVQSPFWAPDEYYTHECPDLFRMGDWWYLVYSTFSERCVTHYRMSRALDGPWLAPANDTFDGRAYYAAKTASDGHRRYTFGWLPTRVDDKDDGGWQWGGELVVHELEQQTDGTLTVRAPKPVLAAFRRAQPFVPRPVLGDWQISAYSFAEQHTLSVSAHALGRYSALRLTEGPLPEECLVEATLAYAPGTVSLGLLLRADDTLDAYYQVRLEPASQRIVIDRWPRPGDQPFMLERPLALAPDVPVRLRAFLDGTCLVVYANDQVALSCRMYAHREGALGLFVTEGQAHFGDLALKTRRA